MRKGLVFMIVFFVILATGTTTFALTAANYGPDWYLHIYEIICEAEGNLESGFLIAGFPFFDKIVLTMKAAYDWVCALFGVKGDFANIMPVTVPVIGGF